MEKSSRKKDYIYCGIIIVLIAVILSLVSCSRIGKIDNPSTPTGNVDIFNIGINCTKKNKDSDEKCTPVEIDDNTGNNTNNGSGSKNTNNNNNNNNNNQNTVDPDIPIYNPETDDEVLEQVFVDDVNGDYIYQNKLDIFNNPAYEYTNKIAPGVGNSYDFKVHNQNASAIVYKITINEQSEYKVNLKYRLSKNGSYLIGDDSNWVSANDLVTSMMQLAGSDEDSYRLDWKWFDHAKDTEAGENMTSTYKLKVRFDFELAE